MEKSKLVAKTEDYVRDVMTRNENTLLIAHDFRHADRVRNMALVIARGEGFPDLEIVEVTALLHDIGLGLMKDSEPIKDHVILPSHGPLGAEKASEFLKENSDLDSDTIELVADAIRHHSDPPWEVAEHSKTLGTDGKLIEIIQDADNIDAMGAVGIMRAFTSKYFLPEYDSEYVKGLNWESASEINPPVNNIIDQINQQIRYRDNLHTDTAKVIAEPLIRYMKDFILQLESEIDYGKTS